MTILISSAAWDGRLIVAIIAMGLLTFLLLLIIVKNYKKCPSNKIMVIYGKLKNDGKQSSCKCVHGGAWFIMPILQSYAFLDLAPITTIIDLTEAQTSDKKSVRMSSSFTFAISTLPNLMQTAAERLLGLDTNFIEMLAHDIILGQIRLLIASKTYDEIEADRDGFLSELATRVNNEIEKVGLWLININISSLLLS